MNERTDCGNFLVGLFVGAALGSMAALLLAPKSGTELRRGFTEGRDKLRETTSRTVNELRGSGHDAREAFERARDALAEAVEGLREATRSLAGR